MRLGKGADVLDALEEKADLLRRLHGGESC